MSRSIGDDELQRKALEQLRSRSCGMVNADEHPVDNLAGCRGFSALDGCKQPGLLSQIKIANPVVKPAFQNMDGFGFFALNS